MTLSDIIVNWLKEKYPDIYVAAGAGVLDGPEEYIFYRVGSINYYFIIIYHPFEVSVFPESPHLNSIDPLFFQKLEELVDKYLENRKVTLSGFIIQKHS